MQNQCAKPTVRAVNMFTSVTNRVARMNPEALLGTPEALIDRVMSEVLSDLYDGEERERVGELFYDFQKHAAFRQLVHITASEPQIGLRDAGPHLLFAEAWASYAAADMTVRAGFLDLQRDSEEIVFTCCHLLAKWAKAGYRLDWHSLDSNKEGIDTSAPVGKWTRDAERVKSALANKTELNGIEGKKQPRPQAVDAEERRNSAERSEAAKKETLNPQQRLEAERAQEEMRRIEAADVERERRRKLEAERRRQGRCVKCGGTLGFLPKLLGRVRHSQCSEFVDTPPANSLQAADAMRTIDRLIGQCQELAEPGGITDKRVLFHLRCDASLQMVRRTLLGDFGSKGKDQGIAEVRQAINRLLHEIDNRQAGFVNALPARRNLLAEALKCLPNK